MTVGATFLATRSEKVFSWRNGTPSLWNSTSCAPLDLCFDGSLCGKAKGDNVWQAGDAEVLRTRDGDNIEGIAHNKTSDSTSMHTPTKGHP